ncbi:unnamed protein product, partial [Rotaria sp. Silwood1]
MQIRLIVDHQNHRNTQLELSKKRPPVKLLKPIPLP